MCFDAVYEHGGGKWFSDKINDTQLETFHFDFRVNKACKKNDRDD
jgi:hypothetical protein